MRSVYISSWAGEKEDKWAEAGENRRTSTVAKSSLLFSGENCETRAWDAKLPGCSNTFGISFSLRGRILATLESKEEEEKKENPS